MSGRGRRVPTGSLDDIAPDRRLTPNRHRTNSFRLRVRGLVFLVTQTLSRRWRTFRTDRRMFVVTLIGREREDNVLAENLSASGALLELFRAILDTVRVRHRQEGRPQHALAVLSLSSDDLEYSINTNMSYLSDDSLCDELLEMVRMVLSSKRSISMESGFSVDLTVIDSHLRPDLYWVAGLWDFSLPANWSVMGMNKKKYIFLAPTLPQNHRLSGCCALMALCAARLYNAEQKNKFEERPADRRFSRVRGIWSQGTSRSCHFRRESGMSCLVSETEAMVEELGLDLEVWRNLAVPSEQLRTESEKLGSNLVMTKNFSVARAFFQHPQEFRFDLPTVTLMLVSMGERRFHAAAVLKPKTLQNKQSENTYCCKCRRSFSRRFYSQHNCVREGCRLCKRIKWEQDFYVDASNVDSFCKEDGSSRKCPRCKRRFLSSGCFSQHNLFCKADTITCPECRRPYRAGAGQVPHECHTRYCRKCKKNYRYDELQGPGGHACEIRRPCPPAPYDRMAFFDFETTVKEEGDGGEHEVNAVGLSFEEERGVFSEVYFYDDDMQMPQDGKVDERCYTFGYWTEGLVPHENLWKSQAPARLRDPPGLRQPMSEEERVLGGFGGEEEAEEDCPAPRFFLDEAAEVEVEDEEDDAEEEGDEEPSDGAGKRFFTDHFRPSEEGTAMAKFVKFIMSKRFFRYSFIAHNASKFDSILILKEIIALGYVVEPLFDGNKLFQLKIPSHKIRFIDSYKYLKMPLSKFEKRFPSLREEGLAKGVFPFRMNRRENYGYAGEFPGREMFLDEFASTKAVTEYEKFRDSWPAGEDYVFKKEMHKYLALDVRVLRGGCLRLALEMFRLQEDLNENEGLLLRNMKENRASVNYFHLFSHYFTCSSFVHAMFLHFEVPSETVYLTSNQRNARKTSQKERVWLEWISQKERIHILTEWNQTSGQRRLAGRYYPDGTEAHTRNVFEFFGCALHFHRGVDPDADCRYTNGFQPGDKAPFGSTMESAAADTEAKLEFYRENGYTCRHIWECEFDRLLKEDEDLRNFAMSLDFPEERLRIRTALRGGRTETFRMLHCKDRDPETMMLYCDRNSLYPEMSIKNPFPLGVPERLVGKSLDELRWDPEKGFDVEGREVFGLVQATVLPPDSLFLPVLPFNHAGKLMFCLCKTCLEDRNPRLCRHSHDKRWMTSVWTSPELLFAVECGYKIVKVHEMMAYKSQGMLFKRFFTRLARMKLESEGFPEGTETEEEKRNYVDGLNSDMPGLDLDWRRVEKNEGRRAYAKDMSNIGLGENKAGKSEKYDLQHFEIAGKLSQNDLKTNVEYAYSHDDVLDFIFRKPHLIVKNVQPINEDVAEVVCETNDLITGFHHNVNPVLYSFVTAYARIAMMRDMRRLMELGAKIFYTGKKANHFEKSEKLTNFSCSKTRTASSS